MNSTIVPLLTLAILSMNSVTATSVGRQAQTPRQATASADKPNEPKNPNDDAINTKFERLREEGNVAVYNLDYEKARGLFEQMTSLAPDHPAGYVYLANNLWLETLNRSRRLSSSLYNSASFYKQGAAEDKVDAERDQRFNAFIKKALEVAGAWLTRAPNDAQALYYKGAAVGIRAAYNVTVKRRFFSAFGDAKNSVQVQNRVIKLDPNYADANLSIGFYEYIVGTLPPFWLITAKFVGIKGNKKKGVELLETVAERGKYTRDDARVLLLGIYSREGNFERALDMTRDLANKYPRNYLFGIERAALLFRLRRVEEGECFFSGLLADPYIASVATDAVNYQYGEALTQTLNYVSAIERYKAVVLWPGSDPSLVTLAHLHTGQALDALGRRAEAVKEYEIVLKGADVYDSRDLASRYVRKPYVPTRR